MSDHLASFALLPALPDSLAGRYACDYYEASVAIGLASRRRSRVRPCCTYRAERRPPTHLLECPHWASPCAPEVAPAKEEYQRRARHRFRRPSGGWRLASSGDLASGNPALAIFHGSRSTSPLTPGTTAAFLACSCPLHLSDPGQPSDPETSLRVPPSCAGDTTRRLAAHRLCREERVSSKRSPEGRGERSEPARRAAARVLSCRYPRATDRHLGDGFDIALSRGGRTSVGPPHAPTEC
jgi:hypothetical protein